MYIGQSYDLYSQFFSRIVFSFDTHLAPPYAIFYIVIVICSHFHHFSHYTLSDIVLNRLLFDGQTDSQFHSYEVLDKLNLLSKNSEIKLSVELHYFHINFECGECDLSRM